jgi:electron transport complex protein RnfE
MAQTGKSKFQILTNGLIKENPVLVLVIGTCPTLATSTSVETGLGMGLAATAVLICSNIVISALHKLIPDKVRIPCFITVIAGFVTIVQMLLQAFVPSLYSALGLYLPLIVVNCIILGRAEMFASKNSVVDSALDGIGMGLGFTLTLCIMGSIREILGSGTWLAGDWFGLAPGFKGIQLQSALGIPGMGIMTMVPGGFFVFACVMAAVHFFTRDKSKIRNSFGCDGCAMESVCSDDDKAREKGAA